MIAFFFLCSSVFSATLRWSSTGQPDNYWSSSSNWTPQQAPTENDDVIIDIPIHCLITSDSAAKTVTVQGNGYLEVTAYNLIANTFTVKDSAYLSFGGGTNKLTSKGQSTISSPNGFIFQSGNLVGNWTIAPTGGVNFQNSPVLLNSNFVSQAPITLSNVLTVNSSTFTTVSQPLTLRNARIIIDGNSLVECKSGLSSYGQSRLQGKTKINGLTIESGTLTYSQGDDSTATNVVIKNSATLTNENTGHPTFTNVDGKDKGIVLPTMKMTFLGTFDVDTLHIKSGSDLIKFSTTNPHTSNLIMDNGGISTDSPFKIDTVVINNVVSFVGSNYIANTVNFIISSGSVNFQNTIFNVTQSATVNTAHNWLLSASTLSISPQAKLNINQGGALTINGQSGQEAYFNNFGNVYVNQGSSLSVSLVKTAYAGMYDIYGTLTLSGAENTRFNTKSLGLLSTQAQLLVNGAIFIIDSIHVAERSELVVNSNGVTFNAGDNIANFDATTPSTISVKVILTGPTPTVVPPKPTIVPTRLPVRPTATPQYVKVVSVDYKSNVGVIIGVLIAGLVFGAVVSAIIAVVVLRRRYYSQDERTLL